MTIENNGPGGVTASYGKRETSGSRFDLESRYDYPAYVKDGWQVVAPDGQVVGGGGVSSEWAYRMYGAGFGDLGYGNVHQEILEVPHEPGQLVEVWLEFRNSLSADTGTGAGSNNGNGRYAVRDVRFASGSSFADHNATDADGVTPATFVDVARTGDYQNVDNLGITGMINFVPAAQASNKATGKCGYARTPAVLLETKPRRDGRPGSLIYIQGRVGGGNSGSQHPYATINTSGATSHEMDVPFRRRGYYHTTFNALNTVDWAAATDTSSQFFPWSLRIRSAQKTYVVGNCGDSTQQGNNTPCSVLNATHITMQELNKSKALGAVWGYLSYAEGATAPAFFHGLLRDHLINGGDLPDIVFVQVHSQNVELTVPLTEASPFNMIDIKKDWQRVLQLVALGEKIGVKIVPMTQPPTVYIQDIYAQGGANQATALGMEANRVKLNGWIRASGLPFLDVDQIVTGGTYSNGIAYLRNYNGTGDGHHPDLESHTLVSEEQQKMVLSLLSQGTPKGAGSKPPYTVTYAPAADGTKTVFAVPHGLGVVPTSVQVVGTNALTVAAPFAVSKDVNQVYMTYATAPAAGTLGFDITVRA